MYEYSIETAKAANGLVTIAPEELTMLDMDSSGKYRIYFPTSAPKKGTDTNLRVIKAKALGKKEYASFGTIASKT